MELGHHTICQFLISKNIDTSTISSTTLKTFLNLDNKENEHDKSTMSVPSSVNDLELELLEASKSGDLDVVEVYIT